MNDVGPTPGKGYNGTPAVPDASTLVIRAWHEDGAQPPGFRARITYGPGHGEERTTVSAADRDKVLHVVQQWLLTQSDVQGRN
ncbi:hypothetical protein [Arthrobacter sp. P2b]|uniref:hypothetical protein n=1 Tax=Arthrobacter sp. P2b TaxID=1938741 RepID=UPI0011163FF5|nr:hypothetical protein [Arthrobacter sp. P2b]